VLTFVDIFRRINGLIIEFLRYKFDHVVVFNLSEEILSHLN